MRTVITLIAAGAALKVVIDIIAEYCEDINPYNEK